MSAASGDECDKCGFLHAPDRSCESRIRGLAEPPAATMPELRVGARVLVTQGYSKGERGVVTNSPGRVFAGWTVKLDNGRIFGAGKWELRAES